ncbi:ELAV-like protein 4 [Cichlidogyrus casuarinus]|uniref:ELAV-like protein 4 n=1 Tax=Cichlidogyrus casuarinus TaxID=1844966 RepID=A0ABD2PTZ0_9PLAT
MSQPGQQLEGSASDENKTNLIVNYLPPNLSQDNIREIFGKYGKLASCKLIRDKASGKSAHTWVQYPLALIVLH